ncbi:ATP-binding protein [Streptomyces sp. NPDC098789]|uniref:ATP-binding protein n=1 Tax=Streptomyces sp. NPDC098789 TaxID=3366098 RepID=UPI0037F6790B
MRDWLVLLLCTFGHEEIVEQLRLCVSEVVTNAYLHTRTDLITVDVSLGSTAVTVWVTDDRPEWLPRSPHVAPPWRSDHGRGLFLVSRLADRWDVEATGTGKRLGFSIDYGRGAA